MHDFPLQNDAKKNSQLCEIDLGREAYIAPSLSLGLPNQRLEEQVHGLPNLQLDGILHEARDLGLLLSFPHPQHTHTLNHSRLWMHMQEVAYVYISAANCLFSVEWARRRGCCDLSMAVGRF